MQLFLVLKNRLLNLKITEVIAVRLQNGIISDPSRCLFYCISYFKNLELLSPTKEKMYSYGLYLFWGTSFNDAICDAFFIRSCVASKTSH